MKQYAIEVNHVSMLFHLNRERVDNAKEYVIRFLTRKLTYTKFWALKDVTFKVEKGDRVGVLGFNGAGKSTLLKTIAGVLKPTTGNVKGVAISGEQSQEQHETHVIATSVYCLLAMTRTIVFRKRLTVMSLRERFCARGNLGRTKPRAA